MKNIILRILVAATFIGSIAACSDEEFASKYSDPSKTTKVTCEKLMTGMLFQGKNYTFKIYYSIFYWDTYGVSRFSQTLGFLNSPDRYQLPEAGYKNRWENFYNLLTQYRLLEKTYNNLSDKEKPDYEVFLLIGRSYMLDHLAQMADAFGDIPFTKAGFLATTGDVATARPSYDTAQSIYQAVLDGLKEANDKIAAMIPSSLTSSYLTAQDFVNKGDLTKWRKYINSVRLRVAMRLSSQGAMADAGKAAVKEILDNPTLYPTVDNNEENSVMMPDEDGFLDAARDPQSGYETWQGQFNRASQAMIDALNGDPRLEIMFDENSAGNYVGVDPQTSYEVQLPLFEKKNKENYYCAYDSATFSRNRLLPGIMMDAAEVSFTKAEAYQRNITTGDARQAFIDGVKQSIKFYYGINATGAYRVPISAPDDATMQTFAEMKWDTAADKLEAIMTQKWLNYSWMQASEAWAEIRRTGLPNLNFPTDDEAKLVPNVPNRMRYPSSEADNNTANYPKEKDNWTDKMFWAK